MMRGADHQIGAVFFLPQVVMEMPLLPSSSAATAFSSLFFVTVQNTFVFIIFPVACAREKG